MEANAIKESDDPSVRSKRRKRKKKKTKKKGIGSRRQPHLRSKSLRAKAKPDAAALDKDSFDVERLRSLGLILEASFEDQEENVKEEVGDESKLKSAGGDREIDESIIVDGWHFAMKSKKPREEQRDELHSSDMSSFGTLKLGREAPVHEERQKQAQEEQEQKQVQRAKREGRAERAREGSLDLEKNTLEKQLRELMKKLEERL